MFRTKVVEKIKTRFMFNNLFPKIVLFMRYCKKNTAAPERSQMTI